MGKMLLRENWFLGQRTLRYLRIHSRWPSLWRAVNFKNWLMLKELEILCGQTVNWDCGKVASHHSLSDFDEKIRNEESLWENALEQQDNRRKVCLDLSGQIENDYEFIKDIIIGDESWIFEYDPKTKASQRHHFAMTGNTEKAVTDQLKERPRIVNSKQKRLFGAIASQQ